MVFILAKQKVKNFDEWKNGFLGLSDSRKSAGASNSNVYINPNDNTEVVIFFEWDSFAWQSDVL